MQNQQHEVTAPEWPPTSHLETPHGATSPLLSLGTRTRRHQRLLLTGVAVVSAAGLVGTAFTPWLLVNEPLWLVALSPGLHNVLLVATRVDPLWLIGVGAARRVVSLACTFLLGAWFGSAMLQWVRRRSPRAGAMIGFLERLQARLGALLLVAAPIHTLAGLAGSARMRLSTFLLASSLGQLAQLYLSVVFGGAISNWTEWVTRFVREHLGVTSAICLLLVLASASYSRWRRGAWLNPGLQTPAPGPSPAEHRP